MSSFDKTPLFARDTVEASCKYMNYMDRQVKEMEGWRRNQDFRCVVSCLLRSITITWNAMTDLQSISPQMVWWRYYLVFYCSAGAAQRCHPPAHVVRFISSCSFLRSCSSRIPADIEYTHERLPSMSSEEIEKLNQVRPETFAAASQMQGITPHSLVYLYNHVTRRKKVPCVCGINVA